MGVREGIKNFLTGNSQKNKIQLLIDALEVELKTNNELRDFIDEMKIDIDNLVDDLQDAKDRTRALEKQIRTGKDDK